MGELLQHTLSVFFGFFAIMNPIANSAVFAGLTGGADVITRRQIARQSLFTAFGIVLFFCLVGKGIFELFGITLPALRITGGILVFLVGFHMLQGEPSKIHQPQKKSGNAGKAAGSNVAISPLAIPILAGPGTIATAMNFSASRNFLEVLITIGSFAVLCLITYLFFISQQRVMRLLGRNGLEVTTRLMGFILAVVGTQMLLQGMHDARALFLTISG